MSGKSMTDREEFQQALGFLREKDVLIVESLDRLGRNYDDIGQMEQQRLDRKEIGLQVLNLPILNHDLGDPNLQKLIRNMTLQLLSWTAQNECGEILPVAYQLKSDITYQLLLSRQEIPALWALLNNLNRNKKTSRLENTPLK